MSEKTSIGDSATNPMAGQMAWRTAFAGLIALAVAMGIGRFVYTPILPHMIVDGALNPENAGFVAGVNFLGYFIGALIAAFDWFSKRAKFWFFVGLTVSVLTTLAMGFMSADIVGLFAMSGTRFLSGLASAFTLVFASSLVLTKLQAMGRPELNAVLFAGVGSGITISAILVSLFAANGHGWQAQWLASGALALCGLFAVIFLLPQQDESQAREAQQESGKFSVGLWLLIAGYGFFGFGYVITATFINAIADADPALAHVEPYVWPIVGLCGVPSIWFWNRVAAKIGAFGAYISGSIVEALGVAGLYFWKTPLALLVCGGLFGFTFIAVTAIGLASARLWAGRAGGRAIAVMTASFALGQMLGPLASSLLYGVYVSFDPSLLAAIVAIGITVGLTLLASKSAGK